MSWMWSANCVAVAAVGARRAVAAEAATVGVSDDTLGYQTGLVEINRHQPSLKAIQTTIDAFLPTTPPTGSSR